jgi:hypothetical protein
VRNHLEFQPVCQANRVPMWTFWNQFMLENIIWFIFNFNKREFHKSVAICSRGFLAKLKFREYVLK